jgi:hypothetical protein
MARAIFRLAVLASSMQVQQDRLSYAARHRGESQSQYCASRHSVDCQHNTFTNEF